MERLIFVLTFLSILGTGLVAGIFFAFSVFVMRALGRLPPTSGITAMRSINVAVLNPVFFAAFFGTAVLSLALAVAALVGCPYPICSLAACSTGRHHCRDDRVQRAPQ